MNKFTKVVNIYPSMPITSVNPPIRSTVKRVTKSVDEIRACLMARAVVEEILSDGKIVRLNIGNYDKCLEPDKSKCNCGGNCNWQPVDDDKTKTIKTPWQIAYDNAIAGKNLAAMTRKQRRSIEAAARAAADAAVAVSEPEVKIGVGSIESAEETKESVVTVTEDNQEEVKTEDIENVSSAVE